MTNAATVAVPLQPPRFFANTALLIHLDGLACFAWIALLLSGPDGQHRTRNGPHDAD